MSTKPILKQSLTLLKHSFILILLTGAACIWSVGLYQVMGINLTMLPGYALASLIISRLIFFIFQSFRGQYKAIQTASPLLLSIIDVLLVLPSVPFIMAWIELVPYTIKTNTLFAYMLYISLPLCDHIANRMIYDTVFHSKKSLPK